MRLIDAEPIEKFIEDGLNNPDKLKAFGHDAIEVLTEIHFARTIDPESLRQKGEWKPRTDVVGFANCSVCHECNIYIYDDWADGKKWNFCPNCGADMRGAT